MCNRQPFVSRLFLLFSLFCFFTPGGAYAEDEIRRRDLPVLYFNLMDVYDMGDKVILTYLIEADSGGYPAYYRDLRLQFNYGSVFLEGDLGTPLRPYAAFDVECVKTEKNKWGREIYGRARKITANIIYNTKPEEIAAAGHEIQGRIMPPSDLIMQNFILKRNNQELPNEWELKKKDQKNAIGLGLRAIYKHGDISHSFTLIAPPSSSSPYARFRFVTSEGVAEAGEADRDPLRQNGWIIPLKRQEVPERYKLSERFLKKVLPQDLHSIYTIKIYEATAWRADGSKVDIMPWLILYHVKHHRTIY